MDLKLPIGMTNCFKSRVVVGIKIKNLEKKQFLTLKKFLKPFYEYISDFVNKKT